MESLDHIGFVSESHIAIRSINGILRDKKSNLTAENSTLLVLIQQFLTDPNPPRRQTPSRHNTQIQQILSRERVVKPR